MNITYIFRTSGKERSIERVFDPVMQYLSANGHCVKASFAKSSKLWPLAMLYNVLRYALLSYFHQNRVFHITGDVQYVACWMNPKNTILTIHDCVTLHNKDIPKWFKWIVHKFWYEKPLHQLYRITCISEATRQDLIHFFPWIQEKLAVVHNPVGREFQYTPKVFDNDCPVILHIGTRNNKNLERVIESLEGIHCKLLIIGKLSNEQSMLLQKYKINFENRFHISDEEIVSAYKNADIVSFPSLFEGFGMPIIEGQTIGRPVVTSQIEPMCSVAGDGAVLVDPESIVSIRSGFLKLIADNDYYESVIKLGRMNSMKYNIKSIANNYLDLYKHIKYNIR